jgi:metal-responsive CopG/Arc/MetJ family transcriptional regulator
MDSGHMLLALGLEYNRGHTWHVKTAISIPDDVFEAAEQLARRLGKSRSELYSAAIASYLDQHRQEGVTERLNGVYGPHQEQAELNSVLATLQALSIPEEKW